MIGAGAFVMLLSGGLWAGLILAVAVERVPQWSRMPIEQYAVDFRRSLLRLDPMAPILGAVSAAGSIAFALRATGRAAALAWVGISLIAAVIVLSTAIAEPMNAQFRRRSEGEVPPGADVIRARWRRLHLARTALATAAFATLVLASLQVPR